MLFRQGRKEKEFRRLGLREWKRFTVVHPLINNYNKSTLLMALSTQASKFKYYKQWDTLDVSDWLVNKLKLPQYSEKFKEIGVDG